MQLCIAIDTAVSEHNQLVVQIERLANRRQHYLGTKQRTQALVKYLINRQALLQRAK